MTSDVLWTALPEDQAIDTALAELDKARAKLAAQQPEAAPSPGATARALIESDPSEVLAALPAALAGKARRDLWDRQTIHLDQAREELLERRRVIRGSDTACDLLFAGLRETHSALVKAIRTADRHLAGVATADKAIERGPDAVKAWAELRDLARELIALRGTQFTIINGSTTLADRWQQPGYQLKQSGVAYLPDPQRILPTPVLDPMRAAQYSPDMPWDHADDPIRYARWEATGRTWVPTIEQLLEADDANSRARAAAREASAADTVALRIRKAPARDIAFEAARSEADADAGGYPYS